MHRAYGSLLGILLLLLFPWRTYGQLSEADSLRLNVLFNTTGSLSYGNIDRQLMIGDLQVVYRLANNQWAFKTQNGYRYGMINNRLTENDFTTKNYIYFNPDKIIYPYALFFFEENRRLKIDLKYQTGVGITYRLARSSNHLMKLSATLLYEYNEFDQGESESELASSFDLYRLASRIFGRHSIKATPLKLYYELVLLNSLSSVGNLAVIGELGVDLKISKSISIISRASYLHQDISAEDVSSDDLFMTYGFNFKFQSSE